jgi:hypothetical protein
MTTQITWQVRHQSPQAQQHDAIGPGSQHPTARTREEPIEVGTIHGLQKGDGILALHCAAG